MTRGRGGNGAEVSVNHPYQQMKVRSQPVANITKKHGGMQHPGPVVPTKSGHSKSDRR